MKMRMMMVVDIHPDRSNSREESDVICLKMCSNFAEIKCVRGGYGARADMKLMHNAAAAAGTDSSGFLGFMSIRNLDQDVTYLQVFPRPTFACRAARSSSGVTP